MKRCYRFFALLLALALLASGAGLFAVPAQAAGGTWVSSWGSSLVNGSATVAGMQFHDVIPMRTTLRTELTVTTGGTELSFVFSNQYGSAAVTIDAASIARSNTAAQNHVTIQEDTQTPITFNGGQTGVTIPAGKRVASDAIVFKTSPMETLNISLYFSHTTYMTSVGLSNGRTFMRSASSADHVNAVSLSGAREVNIGSGAITYHTIPFLERIDTLNHQPNACTAVFIGDSTLVNDTYLYYARRITTAGVYNVGVINEAIIGNKLLSDGSGIIGNLYGQAMRDRFQRDVLDIPGVKYCFVKIGLNDVLHQFSKTLGDSTPKNSAENIIQGYRDLIRRCHERGIKIYFFTKSPWMGYERNFLGSGVDITWTQQEQDMCDKLTNWVLTNKEADGAIDCSPLADPSEPRRLCPSFTPDGAHLTPLGSIALADLIPPEYVGVPKGTARTAASITNTDPYKEKREIQQRMANGGGSNNNSGRNNNNNNNNNNNSNNNNNNNSNSNRNNNNSTTPTQPNQTTPTQPYNPTPTQPNQTTPTQPNQTTPQQSEPSATVPYTPNGQSDQNGGALPNGQINPDGSYTPNGQASPNGGAAPNGQEITNTYANDPYAQQSITANNASANTPAKVSATSDSKVGLLLVFGLAMVIAVSTVVLTMMRKKENQ